MFDFFWFYPLNNTNGQYWQKNICIQDEPRKHAVKPVEQKCPDREDNKNGVHLQKPGLMNAKQQNESIEQQQQGKLQKGVGWWPLELAVKIQFGYYESGQGQEINHKDPDWKEPKYSRAN